jgi:hypothetical protein
MKKKKVDLEGNLRRKYGEHKGGTSVGGKRTKLTEDGRSGPTFRGDGHMDVIPVRQRMEFKKP